MSRLVPNPLGDIAGPLHRMEKRLGEVADGLEDLKTLPQVHRELAEVNRALAEVVQLLVEIRDQNEVQRKAA